MFGKKSGLIAVGCFLVCGLVIGCGDNGNGGGGTEFTGYIQNFGGVDKVANMEIEVLDNSNGQPLNISGSSDASGNVTFTDLPSGKVGFLCKGVDGETKDTYQFNIDSDAKNEKLWSVSQDMWEASQFYGQIVLQPGKAVMAGGLYWVDDDDPDETEVHVGCATVRADPDEGDIRYTNDAGIPIPPTSTPPDPSRTTTNPLVAYFIIGNLEPGKKTSKAFMGDDEIGTASLFVFGDAISISNIYTDGSQANPMPADCE